MRGRPISERALEKSGHCVHRAREGSDTDLQPPLNRGAYGSVATETRRTGRVVDVRGRGRMIQVAPRGQACSEAYVNIVEINPETAFVLD